MAIKNLSNINSVGTLSQRYMQQAVLQNFEPELFFYDMGEKPISPEGYATLAWARFNRMTYTASEALLSEGVTPAEKNITTDVVEATYSEYGMYVTISTKFLLLSPVPVLSNVAKQLRNNMARIVDAVVQTELVTNGTYVIYPGAVAARASLNDGDVMTASLLAKASTFLDNKAAPRIAGAFVAQMHPNAIYDLRTENAVNAGWLDVTKYKMPEKVFTGEIGELQGVRIIKNPYIQTITGGVGGTKTIYPSFVMGAGAYGVPTLSSMTTYMTPIAASDSDPLAQRVKCGAKILFAAKVLQQRALLRLETVSSLSASTYFFD